jgi:hypothetical protein
MSIFIINDKTTLDYISIFIIFIIVIDKTARVEQ